MPTMTRAQFALYLARVYSLIFIASIPFALGGALLARLIVG